MNQKNWNLLSDSALVDSLTEHFYKKAQTANVLSVAKKLVNSLQRKVSDQPEPPNITSATPVDLKINSLHSVDDLLQYLSTNQIKVDGAQVVYNGAAYQQLSEEDRDKLASFSTKMTRDGETRKFKPEDYWVYLPSLVKYVDYLKDKAASLKKSPEAVAKAHGDILEVMIGKIIDQINKVEPNSGLKRTPKSQPGKPKEVGDDEILDQLNDKNFDERNAFKNDGPKFLLKARNLQNRTALNDWLLNEGGSTITSYKDAADTKGTTAEYGKGGNPCIVMNILWQRANRNAQYARTDQAQKNAQWYVNKIKEIGATFTGPDGQACPVTTVRGSGQPGQKPGQPGAGQASNDPAALNNTIDLLPLRRDMIDFGAIENFFQAYTKLLSVDETPRYNALAQAMHNARQAMANAAAQTVRSDQQYRMTNDLNHWKRLIQKQENMKGRQDQLGTFVALTDWLQDVIEGTAYVIQELQAAYGKKVNATQAAQIAAQIGLGPGSSSIYGANSYLLSEIKRQAQALAQGR